MKRGFEFWFREPLMLGLGAVPATVLLVFPLIGLSLKDPLAVTLPLFLLSLLGVGGLWLATFHEPSIVSTRTLLVSVLLACGLIALLPFSGAIAVGMLRNPLSFRELGETKTWFFLWCFFGPTLCAFYFLIQQGIARVSLRKNVRRHESSSKSS